MRTPHFTVRLLLLALLTTVLAACSGGLPEKVWLEAPGWSRGVTVGTTRSGDRVPMAIDSSNQLWLLLLHQGDSDAAELVGVGESGRINRQAFPDLIPPTAADPDLTWSEDGLVISWTQSDILFAAVVSQNGQVIRPPEQLSGHRPVEHYSVVPRPSGEITFWFSGDKDHPGIYAATMGSSAGPQSIDTSGINPTVLLDAFGQLHVVWIEMQASEGQAAILHWNEADQEALLLAQPNIKSSDVFEGPFFAMEDGMGYLFYVISIRTGLRAGDVDAMVVSFTLGDPANAGEPRRLTVPGGYALDYEITAEDGLLLGPRAPVPPEGHGTAQLTQFALPGSIGPEVPVGLRARVDFLMNQNQGQIGLLVMDGGQPTGYQLLTFTSGNSIRPNLALDDAGHAYMTWKETSDAEELTVYLAGTRPDWIDSFASITQDDAERMVLQSIFGMASGIILTPMVLLWLIAPVIIIMVTSFFRGAEEDWKHPLTWGPILLGVIAYWFVKRSMLPAIFEYVPFSAWVPIIPAWLAPVLRMGLPLAGSLLALWIAYRATYGQDRNSPTFFILIFGATDGIISMMLYGGLFLGF